MDTNTLTQTTTDEIEELAALSVEQLEMIAGGECVVNNI